MFHTHYFVFIINPNPNKVYTGIKEKYSNDFLICFVSNYYRKGAAYGNFYGHGWGTNL